jgi:hypothetical protein
MTNRKERSEIGDKQDQQHREKAEGPRPGVLLNLRKELTLIITGMRFRILIYPFVVLCFWMAGCFDPTSNNGGDAPTIGGITAYVQDTFHRADGPLTSRWIPLPPLSPSQPAAPPPVVKSGGWTIDPSFNYGAAIYQGTFANNQWAAARIQALSPPGTDVQLGLCIRCSVVSGFFNGYYLLIGPNNLESGRAASVEIWEAYNGQATFLAIPYANQTRPLTVGDTIMFMAVGNELILKMYEPNYSTEALISQTVINNDLSGGSPGIVAQTAQASVASQGTQFGQFAAGSFDPNASEILPLFATVSVARDGFTSASGDLIGNSDWTYSSAGSSQGGLQVFSNGLAPTSQSGFNSDSAFYTRFNLATAYYIGASFSPDQCVEATVRAGDSSTQYTSIGLRISHTSSGYTLGMGTSGSFSLATSSFGTLAPFAASNRGDVWLLEMKGIAIFVFKNDILQYICTDDTIPAGSPGVGGVIAAGQTAAGDLVDWGAGNIQYHRESPRVD